MFDGVVVLGVPELVLLLVATGIAVAFLCIGLNSAWKKKKQEQEDVSLEPKRDYFGELLEKMTHEIRSPLDIVIGMSSKMQDDAKNVDQVDREGLNAYLDKVRRDAEVINRRGKATQQLINRAIALAKLQDPAWVELFPFEHISVKALVDGCVRAIEDKHGISITQHVPNNLPSVNGNQALLQRAVDNLLENAVKHSGDSKEILVELSHGKMQDHVTCRVIDKGIGIPPENLKDVFLLGVQLDPSKEGMGFGLSEVKRTVEGLHQGRLDVESVVGRGTTFTIHLPCAD
jgi:signal transduction histidine kinase